MKPHVCPKCEGEALRMMNCAPCKGTGIVWQGEAVDLTPNSHITITYTGNVQTFQSPNAERIVAHALKTYGSIQ
jgi:hypothetical protein